MSFLFAKKTPQIQDEKTQILRAETAYYYYVIAVLRGRARRDNAYSEARNLAPESKISPVVTLARSKQCTRISGLCIFMKRSNQMVSDQRVYIA